MILRFWCRRFFLFLIFISFLASCQYKPTETNYQQVEPDDSNPEITLPIEGYTFEVRGSVDITYRAQEDGTEFAYGNFYLDEQHLVSVYESIGSIEFDSNNYSDGEHTLTFVTVFFTDTGSLASHLHLEGYQLEQSWTMIIDNSPLQSLQITLVEEVDGRLQISWEPFEGLMFENYQLNIYGSAQSYNTIYDVETTTFIDTVFANGEMWCYLIISAFGQQEWSETYIFEDYQPENLYCEVNEEDQAILYWDVCDYYANCNGYRIYDYDQWQLNEIIDIYDWEPTSWLDDTSTLIFGERREYYLKAINSDSSVYNDHLPGNQAQVFLGTTFCSGFRDIIYNPDGYIYSATGTVRAFDSANMEQINYENYTPDEDSHYNLRFVETSGELYFCNETSIRKLDSANIVELEIYQMEDILPTTDNEIRYFAASEDNFFISGMFDSDYQGFLIDINSLDVINIPEASSKLEITSDGNYGLDCNHLFYFSGTTVEQIYDLDYEDIHLFRNNQEFMIISGTDVHVRTNSDQQTVINFQTEYPFVHADIIDSQDILFGTYQNYFQVYDLNSGTLLWEKHVAQPQHYHYLDNKLFSNNGLYMVYYP